MKIEELEEVAEDLISLYREHQNNMTQIAAWDAKAVRKMGEHKEKVYAALPEKTPFKIAKQALMDDPQYNYFAGQHYIITLILEYIEGEDGG